jgi:nicotinamidase-related amidase
MGRESHLPFGPLAPNTVHLCVDMQRIFAERSPWCSPWTERILPAVVSLAERSPERTVFTRFIPPMHADDRPGMWRRYYRRWEAVTRERLAPGLLELIPPLAALAPPATVIDKPTYSPFFGSELPAWLREHEVEGLIVTGAETDVCILATVLGAIDHGYRVTIVADAISSSSDPGHDALMTLYHTRFSEQVETTDLQTVLEEWSLSLVH